jgi:hypothetical protein
MADHNSRLEDAQKILWMLEEGSRHRLFLRGGRLLFKAAKSVRCNLGQGS